MIADLRNFILPPSPIANVITVQIEMLSVSDKEEQQFRTYIQTKILELLKYPQMTDRYEEVIEAHPQTFDWVFVILGKKNFLGAISELGYGKADAYFGSVANQGPESRP